MVVRHWVLPIMIWTTKFRFEETMTTPIECKKDGLAQLQDGCWKLVLKVHLNDMPTWLMSAPMGTRLACAIVEIADDETAVPHEDSPAKKVYQSKTEGEKAVTRAVLLCEDEKFQDWSECWRMIGAGEELINTRDWLVCICQIRSRSELATNPDALQEFLRTEHLFREATGQTAEQR